ncbi:hypothetical protein CSPX01_06718 [Colletotrichum filicis]|nr:hypothetical protein CSPX01_06718 [Colletotrichum filicis]
MTDANTRDPPSLDGTPRLPLQESEPRPSIVETPSRQVLNGSHVAKERPWSRGILPNDFPEYHRQVVLRLSKAHEAGVQWNDTYLDAEWCLPWWEGIDPADLKPGEGKTLWKWSRNGKVSHDSNKESKTVADQHIKALKELFYKKLSGDNRYHESLTKLKDFAEMLDGYPVAKQDFEDAIQPVREAIDVWHEIFAKMGAKSVPIAEADLVSDFGNPISPFLGHRRNVDEKPPNAKFEKDEDISTEEPTPKQPIGDESHNDDRENEDAAAIEASWIGHMPIARGLDEVEAEEEDGNEEAS